MKVSDFLKSWLSDHVANTARPKTQRNYESVVRTHIVPSIGELRLRDLQPKHVQVMLSRQLKSGASPRTVQMTREVLRAALNRAVRWSYIERNAAALVDAPRSPKHERHVLAPSEARGLVAASQSDPLHALYVLTLTCGLRQGEALALSWDDVDLDARTVSVQRNLVRSEGVYRFAEPKTERSRRVLPLSEAAATALRRHRAAQLEMRLAIGHGWNDDQLVFVPSPGLRLMARR